jgi:hypothetical protein
MSYVSHLARRLGGAVAGTAALFLIAAASGRGEAPPEGFTRLFNGRDLEGWRGSIDGYDVVDGAMHCRPGHGGTLFTAGEYDDFVLRFDFKLAPGANNGLGIRMPTEGDPAFVAIESQILDDGHPKYAAIQPWQAHGSLYGVVAAERGVLKPAGEWNTEEVTVRGSRVTVVVNGRTIVDADLAEFRDGTRPTPDGKPHPGLARTRGHVGFLGHGDEVWFRDVFIRPLPATGR